jgi:hypothetical protein
VSARSGAGHLHWLRWRAVATVGTVTSEPNPTVTRWIGWIEGPLVDDVVGLYSRREIWNGINEMARSTPGVGDRPSSFWDYNRDCYAITQAIGVRRLTDLSRGVVSLAKLIHEMRTAARAREFTREVFLAQWSLSDPLLLERAERGWRMFAGGGDHFDRRIADADLAALRDASEQVKDYVDQYIAHRAERPTSAQLPTFVDLHRAIDDMGEMFKKYSQVLKAAHWGTLVAVHGDWQAIFRQPWIDGGRHDPPETTED